MFDKKQHKPEAPSLPEVNVQAMPDAFYGGKDPVIYHNKPGVLEKPKAPTKKIPEKKELAPAPVDPHAATKARPMPVHLQSPKKKLLIGGGILLISVLGIVGYYLWQAGILFSPDTIEKTPVVKDIPVKVIAPVENITEPVDFPPVVPVPTTTPESDINVNARALLQFPGLLLAKATDLDGDGLTDIEEEVFTTDSGSQDSDSDGYVDGVEVSNLYSPKNGAPTKLIDSGLAREYSNPTWKYRLYYPVQWQLDSVDSFGNDVLINAASGDYIMISAYTLKLGQTFESWFVKEAKGQSIQSYEQQQNRFKVPVYVRNDGRVAFVVDQSRVYVILYQQGISSTYVYPTVMRMVWQSFRPADSSEQLPEQVPVPVPGDAALPIAPSTPVVATTTTEMPIVESEQDSAASTTPQELPEVSADGGLDPLLYGESGNIQVESVPQGEQPPAFE